jgi:UDP-galactopyranose mutase
MAPPPDVIVAWLQNDYGELARPAEAIAHALAERGLARRVAYVEPFLAVDMPPEFGRTPVRGVDVYRGRGTPPLGLHDVGRAVVASSELEDPVLLNFGVAETNWWFHYEFAPLCSAAVNVTHDKLELWDAMGDKRPLLALLRRRLAADSDAVCGLSHGSIDDVPGAVYVGHGCDDLWTRPGADDSEEPADLAAIPHPRAMYVGAMSVRFDAAATAALARSGVQVVLIGFDPSPEVERVVAEEPNVHFLGRRSPVETPAYLLRADVGIIPHTDEPFTHSMEPHKAYNYACAGLRTAALNISYAPALGSFLEVADDTEGFVAATHRALEAGRLPAEDVAAARAIDWASVAGRILDVAEEVRRR